MHRCMVKRETKLPSFMTGYQSGGTSICTDIPQQLMLLSQKPSIPQSEVYTHSLFN